MEAGQRRNMCGELVYELRKKEQLTQEQLAARCEVLGFEVSRESVSQIERGIRGVSDLELVILAKALRVVVTDLIPSPLPDWQKDLRSPGGRPEDE